MSRSLKDCRILITGVNGQVGFEIVKSLSASGAELILGVRKLQDADSLGYTAIAIDLRDESSVSTTIETVRPHIVINAAAYTAVDKAEDDSDTAFAVNEKAVASLARAVQRLGGAIIHFSTDYVYNPRHDKPNIEVDPTSPGNTYALSKRKGEEALVESGVSHIIFRTSWVYGANGNNFVKTMLRLGSERKDLRVVNDQIGSPTSAVTLAQVVAALLHKRSEDPVALIRSKQGIYNVSDSGYTNWYLFANEIFRLASSLGMELKVENVEPIQTSQYKTPAERPLNSRLSLEKLNRELSLYTPKWQQSLALFMRQSMSRLI